jgi:hypothetical protein
VSSNKTIFVNISIIRGGVMNKKGLVIGVVLLSLVAVSFNVIASSGGVPFGVNKDEKKATPKAGAPAKKIKDTGNLQGATGAPIQIDRSLIARKRKEIDNTEWGVELIPITGKGNRKEDKIIFTNRRVLLKSLDKQGFIPTNFSLNINQSKKLVWETMQKNGEDIVFFKGEVSSDYTKMTGVISFQELRGNRDYSFISTSMKEIVPEDPELGAVKQ